MRFPGFIGPSYTLQSVNVDCQRCVNLYPEIDALGTGKEREVASLVPTPGLSLKLTLPTSPVRGLWQASNGSLFAVGGNKAYQISSSWVATELGPLVTSTGPVSIADNGSQVVFVDGSFVYSWDINSSLFTLVQDTTSAYPAADLVTFQDGYFIFNKPDTQQFYISGVDAITIDPLDVASSEGSPDNVVGVIATNQNLYVFGSQSTEVYYDSGDTFPFTRIQGAVVDVGCDSAFSIAKLASIPYWMGGDENGRGIVYRMQGYQPERISTPALEKIIRDLDQTTLSSARAYTYQQGGHGFYCLNLPGVNSTWVFDVSTSFWHERAYQGSFGLERHRADCHAVAFGQNVVGDYSTGAIYAFDPDTYNDNGTPISRIRSAPHLSDGLKFIRHNSFQLDLETGMGLDGTGQGTDPEVVLEWSDDGGHTWKGARQMSIGKIGEYKKRAIARRLGSARDRVYRVTITDPVKTVLIGAELDVEGGTA